MIRSKYTLNLGHLFALLSAICFGVAFTNDAIVFRHFQNVSSYVFIAFLLPSLAILLFEPKAIRQMKYFLQGSISIKLLFTSLIYSISAIAITQAYKNGGKVSAIFPISQASILTTICIGYLFLKERDRLLNKVAGAFLILLGVWLLK